MPKFHKGDRVKVVSGVYEGRRGVVIENSEMPWVKFDSGDTGAPDEDEMEFLDSPLERTIAKGNHYMMPNGELVNPNKIFVKGRSKNGDEA